MYVILFIHLSYLGYNNCEIKSKYVIHGFGEKSCFQFWINIKKISGKKFGIENQK